MLVVVLAFALVLPGCKFSPTLAEYEPDRAATLTVDAPPVQEADDDGKQDTSGKDQAEDARQAAKQAAVVYDPDVLNKRYKSAQVLYDKDRAEIETLPTRGGAKKDDGHDNSKVDAKPEDDGDSPDEGGSGDGAAGDGAGAGAVGEGTGGGTGTGEGEGDGDGKGAKPEEEPEDDPDDPEKQEVRPDAPVKEPPTGTRVAAAGEVANIVQMLTGELRAQQLKDADGPQDAAYLVATDENFQESVAEKGVYPGEGVGEAKIAWTKKDGTGGGLDAEAVKKAKADLVLYESDTDTVSSADVKTLNKMGAKALAVNSLRQDSDIVEAVELVAKALAKGDDQNGDKILAKAAEWVEFHDSTIEAMTELNGGYSTFNGYDFNWGDQPSNATTKRKYTLVVDAIASLDWPRYEEVVGLDSDVFMCGSEVWLSNPTSFYLSAAGVVDNMKASTAQYISGDAERELLATHSSSAGFYERDSSNWDGKARGWRFNANTVWRVPVNPYLNIGFTTLSNDTEDSMDEASPAYFKRVSVESITPGNLKLGPETFSSVYAEDENDWIRKNVAGNEGKDKLRKQRCLGSSMFPAVIARVDSQKKTVAGSQNTKTGLYRYKEPTKADVEQMSFGTDFTGACYLGGEFAVYTAPAGVLSSWLDGSHEAFLFSCWTRARFYNDYSQGKLEKKAEKYYGSFYRSAQSVSKMDLDG